MTIDPALREQEPHGTALFPLRVHEITSDVGVVSRVPPHWHPEIEILVVTAGAAQFHLDGQSTAVAAGDVVFIAPDRLHAFTAKLGTPFAFYAVVFDPIFITSAVTDRLQVQYLDPIFQGEQQFPRVISSRTPWQPAFKAKLAAIRQATEAAAPGFELVVKAELLLAWATLVQHTRQPLAPVADRAGQLNLVKNVLTYIRTHLDQPLGAARLAKQFAVSESHLCRLFKAVTKTTLSASITAARVSKGAQLLTSTALPISEIAIACGFSTISYFNKRFKERLHQTPTAFRQAARL
ncbi:helix-turn-helix domain-containing protein [Lacticaseibacillus jixianensis]|uniref:Helix-turn-helix domain-containing protein n=1 Tax=Lacticaseibacillus jixianensis TaxID=2486012 RepID=A0ABW4B5L1_9LACO|nr:AraC family transcriptional regulator [Lacticaseibacillus jixianensis]